MKRTPILVLALALPVAATANPVVCRYGELTRSIEVVYLEPGQAVPCEVIYDKSGEGSIETLWRATSEANYCETKAAGLVDRLTGLGWSCETPTGDPQPAEIPEPSEPPERH
jgi:hypothetical protein